MLTATIVQAQEVHLENIPSRNFSGLKALPGKGFYFCYLSEKTEKKGFSNFELRFLDENLKETKTTVLEITSKSELASSAFGPQGYMFVFADLWGNTYTYYTLNTSGEVIGKRVEDKLKPALLVPDNYPKITALPDGDFVIVKPTKEEKIGYAVERVDMNFASKYLKAFAPEKGSYKIVSTDADNDRIYVLRKYSKSLFSNAFEGSILSYDIKTGEEVYAYSLFDGEDSGYPTLIKTSGNGELFAGGMYFNGNKFDFNNSDGLFALLLDAKGGKAAYTKTSWKSIKGDIKGDNSYAFLGSKTQVVVEDVIKNGDNSFSIVAETFRKSDPSLVGEGASRSPISFGSTNPASTSTDAAKQTGITVMDFIVFNYDKTGSYKGLTKIFKPTKDMLIKGASDKQPLELALILKKEGLFPFKYTLPYNNNNYIVYISEEGIKKQATFLISTAIKVDFAPNIELDKGISDNLNKLAKFGQMTSGSKAHEYLLDDYGHLENSPNIYNGLIPTGNNKLAKFSYQNGKLDITLEKYPL